MHWAASGGHTEIVKFLLDLGVPFDSKDDVSSNSFSVHAGYCIRAATNLFN